MFGPILLFMTDASLSYKGPRECVTQIASVRKDQTIFYGQTTWSWHHGQYRASGLSDIFGSSRHRAPIGLAGAKASPLFSKIDLKACTDMEIPFLWVGINGRYKKKLKDQFMCQPEQSKRYVSMANRTICKQST